MQLDDGRNIREIDLLHDDIDTVLLAQSLGERFKSVQPARDHNQRMALRRGLAGQLRAEAARCAGDENPSCLLMACTPCSVMSGSLWKPRLILGRGGSGAAGMLSRIPSASQGAE